MQSRRLAAAASAAARRTIRRVAVVRVTELGHRKTDTAAAVAAEVAVMAVAIAAA